MSMTQILLILNEKLQWAASQFSTRINSDLSAKKYRLLPPHQSSQPTQLTSKIFGSSHSLTTEERARSVWMEWNWERRIKGQIILALTCLLSFSLTLKKKMPFRKGYCLITLVQWLNRPQNWLPWQQQQKKSARKQPNTLEDRNCNFH